LPIKQTLSMLTIARGRCRELRKRLGGSQPKIAFDMKICLVWRISVLFMIRARSVGDRDPAAQRVCHDSFTWSVWPYRMDLDEVARYRSVSKSAGRAQILVPHSYIKSLIRSSVRIYIP
jgi:hypothetical protein